jgi:2-polyprenyl-3-methyl-5-hydroxy-6-metoxy-1,4-benzoquinol methylase
VTSETVKKIRGLAPRLLAMLRVKNEERWIEKCLTSLLDLVDGIVILDDGSTDRTREITRTFPKVLRYEYITSPDVNEVRDKNLLLSWTLKFNPDWILALDGDEELGPLSRDVIRREIFQVSRHNPECVALSFRFIYFWKDTYRIDGKYADVWHPRLFTTWNQDLFSLRFNHAGHGAGFHCGSVPGGLIGRVKKVGVVVKHYGYVDSDHRLRKYEFYRRNDPKAFVQGYYEHLVSDGRLEWWRGEADEKRFASESSPYGRFSGEPQDVHRMVVEMAGYPGRVMEVGCGAGHVGSQLKKMGCHVVGVEPNPQAAALAKELLDEVIVERAECFHREDLVGTFDTILLLDVLEDVPDPFLVLANVRKYITEGGSLIICIPNVAHWTVRKMILKGNFSYEEFGIVDRTHLRFFTWDSFARLLKQARLRVTEVRYAFRPDSHHYRRWYFAPLSRLRLLRPFVGQLGPRFPGLFAFQFLVKAALSTR